jgi:ATP-dependent 26S proteasome regulatory subunit
MLEVYHSKRESRRFVLIPNLVRLLREELQLLHEPGSYVGEVVKVMGKSKVLVKVQPEGKYSLCSTLL